VHDSAFLDLGFCILAFLQSCWVLHSPDRVWGMLERVSNSSAVAIEAITAAVVRKVASVRL
jgi:DMSO reductase anchor subunit